MEGAASSSSSCSSTPRSWTYHVFLSFRGEDTRKGFTDHLYASLEKKGIITFRDDKRIERGEVISRELEKAIGESMFAIIILSPNYASSTWCLDELQKIVECNKEQALQIMPLFYDVDPSNVFLQRHTIEEAFKKHEENLGQDSDKVQKWRNALTHVAGYSGWDSRQCAMENFKKVMTKLHLNFNHDLYQYMLNLNPTTENFIWLEAELVENIVQHIYKMLTPKLACSTENLVGIASRVEEVKRVMDMELNNVGFIGIWGMGGIGKTTIARAVYEAIRGEFQVSCFLDNVREMAGTDGLIRLQRHLLSHLNINSEYFPDLYDGKKILRNSLCNKKVLLVLDDVREGNQLEKLVETKQDWFGPGSRIMITARDMHVLRIHGVQKTYMVEHLPQGEALQLFCLKAFKQDQPQKGYLDLCNKVVEYAGGLPLALEVLGSYFFERPINVWDSALEQLRRFPRSEIQDALKISYESLDQPEKDLFLDIACFFKGKQIDKVISILENCGSCPRIGIDVLIDRSLISLNGWYELEMHDLLQQMGRNIASQKSDDNPGGRSRLWSQEDIDDVFIRNKGTEEIQGIVLKLAQPYEAHWSPEAFSKTSQLKFLKLGGILLRYGLNYLPTSLKVVNWRECSLKILPFIDQQYEIVYIKLSHSKLEQLWDGKKFLEKLKYLDLRFSQNLEQLPDISGAPNLETLDLRGCTSLTKVHSSLVHHKKLVLMNFKGCKSLETLPSKLEMSSLEKLILAGCSKFKNLPEIGECMKKLSLLSLEGTAISYLILNDCKELVCLPNTIDRLKSIKKVDISGCSNLNSGVTFPSSTEKLDASDCDSLQTTTFNQHRQQYVPKGLGPCPLVKGIRASRLGREDGGNSSLPHNLEKKVAIALYSLLICYASRKGFYQR